MSDKLSEEMQADLRELFSLADADNSGVLSTKELRWVMNSIGRNPTEVELAEIVTQMDTDGNGTLDVNEFMSLMARKFKEADTMEEVLESFKARARSTRRAPARTPLLLIRNLPGAAPLRDLTPPRAGL